jgi:hypothetical protein
MPTGRVAGPGAEAVVVADLDMAGFFSGGRPPAWREVWRVGGWFGSRGGLGFAIGWLVGGWRSDREVEARERAAVPEGKIVMRDLATPAATFAVRVFLLSVVGIALFFATLLLAAALMAIDPGMLNRLIAFFAGASSVPRSLHQISVDLIYIILIFYCGCMIILCTRDPRTVFISMLYHSSFIKLIRAGGVFSSRLFVPLDHSLV